MNHNVLESGSGRLLQNTELCKVITKPTTYVKQVYDIEEG
jgi:hypothetical protein